MTESMMPSDNPQGINVMGIVAKIEAAIKREGLGIYLPAPAELLPYCPKENDVAIDNSTKSTRRIRVSKRRKIDWNVREKDALLNLAKTIAFAKFQQACEIVLVLEQMDDVDYELILESYLAKCKALKGCGIEVKDENEAIRKIIENVPDCDNVNKDLHQQLTRIQSGKSGLTRNIVSPQEVLVLEALRKRSKLNDRLFDFEIGLANTHYHEMAIKSRQVDKDA